MRNPPQEKSYRCKWLGNSRQILIELINREDKPLIFVPLENVRWWAPYREDYDRLSKPVTVNDVLMGGDPDQELPSEMKVPMTDTSKVKGKPEKYFVAKK